MSRVAANQPTYFKLDIVNVMKEFWCCLQHTLSPHVSVLHVKKDVAMKIFWPDLKLETKKKDVDCYFLCIVTTPDLIKLRSIFGSIFDVGIKKTHPPAEAPPVYCLHSDEVYIDVADDTHRWSSKTAIKWMVTLPNHDEVMSSTLVEIGRFFF